MDTVVNQLLDADKKARELLDDAQQYYDRAMQEIETEKAALSGVYEKKMEARLSEITVSEQTAIHDAANAAKQRYARLKEELDKSFELNKKRWEDEIYSACTGGGGS